MAKYDDSDRLAELEKLQEKLQIMKKSQCFKLSPTKSTAYVHVTLDDAVSEQTVLKGVSVTQSSVTNQYERCNNWA